MKASRGGTLAWFAAALVVIAGLVLVVAVNVPRFPVADRGRTCTNNVSELAQWFLLARQDKRFDPTLHGSAQILSWIGVNGLKDGDERVLICPGDPSVTVPETPDERRPYHPTDAAALRRAVGLGSYAVRDFEKYPLDEHPADKEIVLCDRQGDDGRTMHHKHVIVVGFAGGDAQKMSGEELGFGPDEPIVVGPDSPNPELRKMERP